MSLLGGAIVKLSDVFDFSYIFNWAKRSATVAGSSAQKVGQSAEDLLFHVARPSRKTFMPTPAPQGASQELLDFFQRTEWLQPYFNVILGTYWSFDEKPDHWVSLGTYDQPDDGRTFQIRYNAALVGEVSVVPNPFPRVNDWAELRLRLSYPVQLVDSEKVHSLLSGLASSAFDVLSDPHQRDRAEQAASTAMIKALWDGTSFAGSALVVDMTVSGSWGGYQAYVDHWRNLGVDPWTKYEVRRDSPAVDL